jgi:AcrR family transcriptional regulator
MSPLSPADFASLSPSEQRRVQILGAAMTCFARRGIHLTTMQDISQDAGISVGLIYRYFESKEQVIAALAGDHLASMQRRIAEARDLPTLTDALERVLFCDQQDVGIAASFIVELFAESARNADVRALVRQVNEAVVAGVADLIAHSPEAARLAGELTPCEAAVMVFQAIHGEMFDEIMRLDAPTPPDVEKDRSRALRRISSLLFQETPHAS